MEVDVTLQIQANDIQGSIASGTVAIDEIQAVMFVLVSSC